MIEAVIRFLIGLCVLVLCVVLVMWVLGQLGIVLPPLVVKILFIILALIVVLWLVRLLRPHWGSWFP